MSQSYIPFSFLTGIAVAAAFCAQESPAVTLPTELSFEVTADICTYLYCYWGAEGRDKALDTQVHMYLILRIFWLITGCAPVFGMLQYVFQCLNVNVTVAGQI